MREALADSNIEPNAPGIALDADDPDGQSLLFWYPTVTTGHGDYIRPAVKIESGVKSALDPHAELNIAPYISDDVPRLGLAAPDVTTVVAERTFWDKIVILHGVTKWFERHGVLRGQGQRVSRHYYDVHRVFQSKLGVRAVADPALGADCVAHAKMFFNSPDLGLDGATRGTFSLRPTSQMIDDLRRDYRRMARMIIGEPPRFEEVMRSIAELEETLNHQSAAVSCRTASRSVAATANLPFSEWTQVIPNARLCKALLDQSRIGLTSWRPVSNRTASAEPSTNTRKDQNRRTQTVSCGNSGPTASTTTSRI